MCDYSLEVFKKRPAKVGEPVVTHQFSTLSKGFKSAGDTNSTPTAVCMIPGAIVAFSEPVVLANGRKLNPDQLIGRFMQIDEGPGHYYRDALDFSGTVVSLQVLKPGQEARMESIPRATDHADADHASGHVHELAV